jgi:diguanylate cyclase (GGDEF)-like protein
MKLLYLEDNPIDADLARRVLTRDMPEVDLHVASTLAEARAMLAIQDDFEMVLLDVRLPDGEGLELLGDIRARQLPIAAVLLTGSGDEQTVIRALKLQADDYLVKRDDYLDVLPATLRLAKERFRSEDLLRSKLLTVLYVEHNAADAELTRMHLERHAPHIRLHVAPGADAALKLLLAPEGHDFKVLLLDYRLAGMDALELTKTLRRQHHIDLPIVLVTGRGSEDAAAAALRLGVSDYLIKDVGYLERLPSVLEHAYIHAELRRERARLHYLATYDELTGLLNRSEFNSRSEQVLSRALRLNERCALLMVDLDDFKVVNDTFGHCIGDELLRGFGKRFASLLREEDLCCRFGGDEFLMLLAGIDEATAAHTAERIAESLAERFALSEHEIGVNASIGISIFPDDGINIEALVQNADTAMYKAKTGGRSHFRFFDVAMNEEVAERFRIEADMQRALQGQEYFLVYQPQIEVATGKVVGVEALLRWQHPDKGLIEPDRFIPVAETSGQIIRIGEWVLQTACRQLREWDESGLPPLRVSVNLSARQFRGVQLEKAVLLTLEENGLAPGRLELELTESAVADDPVAARAALKRIKATGVSIAIDDFGTGFSSLSYLKSYPLDRLKIDRSFVAEIGKGEDGAAISSAIIGLAARLGLQAVAEGVEQEVQLSFLKEQGCPLVQGSLISPPLKPDDFVSWLNMRLAGA